MEDEEKTKEQLIRELEGMRRLVAGPGSSEQRLVADLDSSCDLYRTLAESALDIIFLMSRDGYVLYVNSFAASYFQAAAEDIIGKRLQDLFPQRSFETQWRAIQEVFEKGEPLSVEASVDFPGGEVWLDTRLIPVRSRQGDIHMVMGISRDTTGKKKIETELLKAQKVESLGVLAGNIAHEYNNILTAIIGNIILAKMYAKPESEVADILIEAERASVRAEDLTRQLLAFSKGGALARKVISLGVLLADLVAAVSSSDIKTDLVIGEDLYPVDVDEGKIRQALQYLLLNAKQSMAGGGVVRVRAENVSVGRASSLPVKEGDYVMVSIEDQGPGIDKGHLERIFDPFFTRGGRNSGLGLTSSFSIVKNHGGYITVESELGSGTTFHVYVPAAEARTSAAREDERIHLSARKRILVMDDEEIVRNVVDRMLTQCGCEASFAKEGREMIARYREAMESGKPFDAVIVDLIIANGMGGKEAIKNLLEYDPLATAIVSSGYSDDLIMSEYRKFGFKGVLAKPYKLNELSRVLREVLGDT